MSTAEKDLQYYRRISDLPVGELGTWEQMYLKKWYKEIIEIGNI